MSTIGRFRWYFEQQSGCCYLRITDACRNHGGRMLDSKAKGGHQRAGTPTWDHIFPKPRTVPQEPVQLLACYACNNKRGRAPATAAHIALAERLLDEWLVVAAAQNKPGKKAARRAQRKAQRGVVRDMQKRGALPKGKRRSDYVERINARNGMAFAKGDPVDAAERDLRVDPNAEAERELLAKTDWRNSAGAKPTVKTRAEANAESHAAALRGIASRARAQGDKTQAHNMTARAATILAAVRGPQR